MDRALKERIVGALVLLVFIVLVVPVFLDGPSEGIEVVSEPVSLPGQNGQPSKRQTIVLERDRTEPVPVSGTAADVAPEAASSDDAPRNEAPADDTPAPRPDATPAQVPAAAAADTATDDAATSAAEPPADTAPEPSVDAPAAESTTGMWAVQLGSFAQQDNAERLAAALRDDGYAAFLSRLQGANGPLHRVRIGPQKDRASAEAMATRLAADGHKGQVVPHP